MKRSFLAVAALLTLVIGLFPAGAAYARHDDEIKFTGTIESMPASGRIGDYKISGRTVHVSSSTRIEEEDGQLVVGAVVKVEGTQRSDGSIDATEIEVKQAAPGDGPGDDDGGHQAEVHFKGTIESLPSTAGFIGDWKVGGRIIHVTSSTRIEAEDGPVAVGAFVEIEGTPETDGSLTAKKIEIKSNVAGGDGRDEFKGVIESVPAGLTGDWKVSGRTVHVTSTTVIDQEHGAAVVGAFVEVKGHMRADGSIDATKIEVQTSADDSGQSGNFKGTIESLPSSADLTGDWKVSGRTVHVTSSTRLKTEHGAFAVGVRVKVKGIRMADGTIVATRVQSKD
ncbi:MAG TPA: DUF5666 domain-containing protein [Blastocatellia bacterium]|nr:DUF5666 domain-containing protein [Blastocatellia bacterium]